MGSNALLSLKARTFWRTAEHEKRYKMKSLPRVINAIWMIHMINHQTASLTNSSPWYGTIRITLHFDNLVVFYFQIDINDRLGKNRVKNYDWKKYGCAHNTLILVQNSGNSSIGEKKWKKWLYVSYGFHCRWSHNLSALKTTRWGLRIFCRNLKIF